ncbi:hypothetical protein GW17_00023471 [Ensete ventricosum]|nr:hypothetical protein GW17_00023471 [Ensete ventricosum]
MGEGVGEGNVAQGLEAPPYLLSRGDGADADSGEAAFESFVRCEETEKSRAVRSTVHERVQLVLQDRRWRHTDDLDDAESEADGGVGEGHDSGYDREPPYLIEVGNLRQEHLRDAEHDHVRIAGGTARVLVASLVETIRPFDRPVSQDETTRLEPTFFPKEKDDLFRSEHSHHANGGSDGVTDSDAEEGELRELTEVSVDRVRVVVVALPGDGVAEAVAVSKESGGVVGDEGEEEHDHGAGDPAELRNGPGQRQHAGANHRRDDLVAGSTWRRCSLPSQDLFLAFTTPNSNTQREKESGLCGPIKEQRREEKRRRMEWGERIDALSLISREVEARTIATCQLTLFDAEVNDAGVSQPPLPLHSVSQPHLFLFLSLPSVSAAAAAAKSLRVNHRFSS